MSASTARQSEYRSAERLSKRLRSLGVRLSSEECLDQARNPAKLRYKFRVFSGGSRNA